MLQSWFTQREAALGAQITRLGTAEGNAAAAGDTTAVRIDGQRISQLTAVQSFLHSALSQLTAACGTS